MGPWLKGGQVDASDRSAVCAPLAALLYKADAMPALADVLAGPKRGFGYSVSHVPDASEGWVELLASGLTFDLHGLKDGPPAAAPPIATALGLAQADLGEMRWLTLAPGPHLAGAGGLLPVIRVAAMLLIELAEMSQAGGISWIPAHLVLKPALFRQAVLPWLEGGPFPAPAFVAMHRLDDGSVASRGLNLLMGQEFILKTGSSSDPSLLARTAVRLVDWLVAHGPVLQPTRAILAGTGAVSLEAESGSPILARCD